LGLTHALPYDDDDARLASARAARAERPQDATPAATVHMAGGDVWRPEPDLLRTGPFGQRFVVEMHTDGRAQLRFGDDTNGRQPQRATVFDVVFRIGNGPSGNVGADSLDRLHPPFEPTVALSGALVVRNPLPATGGAAPETLTQARLAAPVAFRRQERAVTASDYAEAAMRLPEVQKAAATRRWTGSWFTFFVTVDRRGGLPVDAPFEAKLRDYFDAVRLAGYDVEIDGPKPAAIDLELEICVQSGLRRETVAAKLREELSSRVLVDGRRGFFHPDELSFGQPVYLSRIVARAMAVEGVQSVQPKRFQRWRESDHGERAAGVLTVGRLEIARLDDDPNRPENGRLTLSMRGGL
jgi:predicted phage baseplate assembly protein